jgi:hypothetical protein
MKRACTRFSSLEKVLFLVGLEDFRVDKTLCMGAKTFDMGTLWARDQCRIYQLQPFLSRQPIVFAGSICRIGREYTLFWHQITPFLVRAVTLARERKKKSRPQGRLFEREGEGVAVDYRSALR